MLTVRLTHPRVYGAARRLLHTNDTDCCDIDSKATPDRPLSLRRPTHAVPRRKRRLLRLQCDGVDEQQSNGPTDCNTFTCTPDSVDGICQIFRTAADCNGSTNNFDQAACGQTWDLSFAGCATSARLPVHYASRPAMAARAAHKLPVEATRVSAPRHQERERRREHLFGCRASGRGDTRRVDRKPVIAEDEEQGARGERLRVLCDGVGETLRHFADRAVRAGACLADLRVPQVEFVDVARADLHAPDRLRRSPAHRLELVVARERAA